MSDDAVRELPVERRGYPWMVYAACAALLAAVAARLAVRPLHLRLPHAYGIVALLVALLLLAAVRVMRCRAARAERDAAALRRVLDTGLRLRLSATPEDLLRCVAEAARALTGAVAASAYLPDEEDPALLKRVVVTPPDAVGAGPAHLLVPAAGRGPCEEVDGAGRTLLAPLESAEMGVTGLLLLSGLRTGPRQDERDALGLLTAQAAVALENARLHERALARAAEDGLTGLLNHRAFQTRLMEEVDRATRGGQPLSLLMIDLDNFGAINNTRGHQAGDAVLVAVAATLRARARVADVPARYGGDEFAVILPGTALEEALDVAERMRLSIAARMTAADGASVRVNASVGVASLPLHARGAEELLRAADQAAYAAKHAGKGRVSRPEHAALRLDRDPSAQLKHANMATVEALAAAVDAKDPYTRGHSQRVSAYAETLARALGLSEAHVARVRLAGLLHDVGKIGVPDAILTKPGKLNDEEFAILKQHPVIGERMLAAAPFLRDVLPAVRHHHERWDGQGYPDGLAGTAVPTDAAIIMVADSFDAMTSSRTYRPALPFDEACRRVREGSGVQYDPRVTAAFERAIAAGALRPLSSDKTTQLHPERVLRAG